MKKLFMLLPLAAIVFASCSSENDEKTTYNAEKGEAIRFTTGIQGMTRGLVTIADFNAFNVTAVHNDPTYAFQDLAVTKSGGDWTYGNTDKYWPSDNSNLKFFAYAPASLSTNMSIADTEQKLTAFTQAQKVDEQTDILAAAATGNKSNNASSGMALDFKHALSQIEVRAKNSNTTDYTVEVLGVKICRVADKGAMTFQTAADAYPTWANQDGSQSFIKKGTAQLTLTSSAQNIMFGADNFLMVPQQLTAWTGSDTDPQGAYLSVLCRITKNAAPNAGLLFPKQEGETPNTQFAFSSVPISTNWTAGHKYVYTIDFFGAGGGGGQFDPNPTNPENPSDPQVDPTPGGEGDEPGDPIVPGVQAPLSFTVSITDWINGEGDNETLNM